ncbi:hypothetical protein IMCC3317_41110 [Kordia antarctica]|uniref:Uncharacterized protein n=1 Tax=Kordia antarctica TaxID=1218801 RepID=A0A7L4ZQG4_9FLAO|nr:hypothetical protein [Kordia antarctica]QHI38717.1 hypothetical protein IMCC3317_41110 [Kordia antarctica]
MKKLVSLFVVLCVISTSYAQEFELPKNYKLVKAEDYDTYAQDFVKATKWITNTPLSEETTKRKDTYAFIMKWLQGSPKVSITISQDIATFIESSDCLIVYMAGWGAYCVENDDYKDNLKGNVSGIESVISFYNRNKGLLGKIKAVEKYKKLQKKGKLASYIESKL